jgi:hypothetical protein
MLQDGFEANDVVGGNKYRMVLVSTYNESTGIFVVSKSLVTVYGTCRRDSEYQYQV